MTRKQLWDVYEEVRFWLLSSVLTAQEQEDWLALLGEVIERLADGEGL